MHLSTRQYLNCHRSPQRACRGVVPSFTFNVVASAFVVGQRRGSTAPRVEYGVVAPSVDDNVVAGYRGSSCLAGGVTSLSSSDAETAYSEAVQADLNEWGISLNWAPTSAPHNDRVDRVEGFDEFHVPLNLVLDSRS